MTSVLSARKSKVSSSAKGHAREPLSDDELNKIDAYWSACNYLAAGMIYLRDTHSAKKPLKPEQIKVRLLGHWGSSPGLSFAYIHLNRLIVKYDLDAIFLAGPGHGAGGAGGRRISRGRCQRFIRTKRRMNGEDAGILQVSFSFPGGIGSHRTPETPGSIHEGGELGYSISHAFGAAFDNPDLLVTVMVGDGEAETGPLATAWHSNKFLNPIRDGAVLPILHLNGYKINNPTILSRISHEELEDLFKGYGWTPHFVEGSDPKLMHQKMAATMEECVKEIQPHPNHREKKAANLNGPRLWPMIVQSAVREGDGRGQKRWMVTKWRDFGGAHQVPLSGLHRQSRT